MKQLNIGMEAAWTKITRYCAYQERSHSETKQKLYSYGLYEEEINELLVRLISEDYLNEERFAQQFARGKSNLKGWGVIKIQQELRRRNVSDWCIRQALSGIDIDTHQKNIMKAVKFKEKQLMSEKNSFIKRKKIERYLQSKGFDYEQIKEALSPL
jgi:regulatory protein